MVRPRSAVGYISIGGAVSREQRNKTSRSGHAVGHYTLHLDYNKGFNNDLPMRAKPANPIRMIQMVARKPLDDRIIELEKTPGMHKLGRPQASWGGVDGSLGGTGEKLVRKKSAFASLGGRLFNFHSLLAHYCRPTDQQSREQKNKTGHTPHADLVDLMYDQVRIYCAVCITPGRSNVSAGSARGSGLRQENTSVCGLRKYARTTNDHES